jgi:N-acetylglucosaminyl-diphospho-decaprenol L-rhamnosyltransferase
LPTVDKQSLSVIIVSWNVRALLDGCLQSLAPLRAARPTEVLVVDNASGDGTPAWLAAAWPDVRLMASPVNLGFGRANNAGLVAARGEWLLLLNPDTVVCPGAVETLIAFLEAHPRAGMVAPRLRYGDGALQRNAFRFPGLAQVFLDLFPLHPRLLESRLNGRYAAERRPSAAPFRIDHPLGAAMLIRRAVYARVGGFDERFFMYAEELDWCRRIRAAGWEIWQAPAAEVVHLAGRSTRQVAGRMYVELWRARYRFFRKHYGRAFLPAARALVRAGMVRKAAAVTLEAWRGRRPPAEARALRRAYAAVFRL